MPRKAMDLSGQTFGSWTVVRRGEANSNRELKWLCRCVCGNESQVVGSYLRAGKSTRCKLCSLADLRSRKRIKKPGPPRKEKGWITPSGYVEVRKPEHANARKNGAIFQHVVVMSEILGRPLVRGENVHHKNGVRDDNRPENLELWVTSQPAGQRPEDLVVWAKEILRRYDA